jgi:hypothetical protein
VYQDSATKQIDSVYLYKQEITINDRRKAVDYNYEQLQESLNSSLYGGLVGGRGLPIAGAGYLYNLTRLNDFLNTNTCYFSGKVGEVGASNSDIKFIEIRDSINYEKKFVNVKIFQNQIQEFSYQASKVFYSKHVGLLRKELFNGQVWNLIRYHVTQ